MSVTLLAIETSCDETSVAVVSDGRRIRSNVVASQVALHARTGGIVPEVAARAHLRWMVPVLEEACAIAGVGDLRDLDGVAVTQGPGLAGSLLVGITMGRTIAWDTGLPLVPVNHLEGHIRAAWLLDPDEPERPVPAFPLVALVVSGGHTFLVEQVDELRYRLLGQTVDDAAGEAFDKVGRLLGLPYPGGPAIMSAALTATRHDRRLPRAWMGRSGDFSFSGLKTAVRRMVSEELVRVGAGSDTDEPDGGRLPPDTVAEIAWSFQESVIDVLATKTLRAASHAGARTIVVGGGVAANRVLRERIAAGAQDLGVPLVVPRPALCTDNGAMIGAAGHQRLLAGTRAARDLEARPSWKLAQPPA